MPIQELMPLIIIFIYLVIAGAIVFGILSIIKYFTSRKASKENLEDRVSGLKGKKKIPSRID